LRQDTTRFIALAHTTVDCVGLKHARQFSFNRSAHRYRQPWGSRAAKAPKALLAEYTHAIEQAAKIRVETAASAFAARPRKEQKEAHARAAAIEIWSMRRSFVQHVDEVWDTECPACKSRSFLAGVKYDEEISEDNNEDDLFEELVDVSYVAEEFQCPSCNLHLETRDGIEAAGLQVDHIETETRQREYEPDYGND
jgi:hypothetical protein